MSAIRRLPETVANRIAAGEVVERPASVVKELVENAIDAGAGEIDVAIEAGGRGLILVADDGSGMDPDELPLALERHATSKLTDDQLVRITTLGFRGEALPSIAAVSRLRLTSRRAGAAHASALLVEGGSAGAVLPAAGAVGTRVEVRDLFYKVPARLKFLRSDRTEGEAVEETLRRLALSRPDLRFALTVDGRSTFLAEPATGLFEDALLARLASIMGREFAAAALAVEAEREGIGLRGFIGLPTLSRRDAKHQHLVVNGRPVQDRLLKAALRAAFADLLFHDRQPLAALFLDLPAEEVDVNVHPQKAEVRFRDPTLVRGLVIGALKRALAEHGHRSAGAITGGSNPPRPSLSRPAPGLAEAAIAWQEPLATFDRQARVHAVPEAAPIPQAQPLGAARAQLLRTYVVAETAAGIVLVDQHAAHERIVYERLKAERRAGSIARQILLLPDVVELDAAEARRLVAHAESLAALGLVVEPFGHDAVLVREVPAALGTTDTATLVRDVAAELAALGDAEIVEQAIDRVLATIACHHSVRAGRSLSVEEMNALLRQMETTPFAGQCNHGRPTYIEWSREELERLFGRRA
ncbi:MAG: DNA mismatch repair endonuclease MutL [Geminicoccaceae bacterium]